VPFPFQISEVQQKTDITVRTVQVSEYDRVVHTKHMSNGKVIADSYAYESMDEEYSYRVEFKMDRKDAEAFAKAVRLLMDGEH
jgi:hypothetical protein